MGAWQGSQEGEGTGPHLSPVECYQGHSLHHLYKLDRLSPTSVGLPSLLHPGQSPLFAWAMLLPKPALDPENIMGCSLLY